MVLELDDQLMAKVGLKTPLEVKTELAASLYSLGKISMGKACELAGIHRLEFLEALDVRGLNVHQSMDNITQDIATLKALGF